MKPISHEAALFILREDAADACHEVLESFPWVEHLSPARRGVLENMAFNMGVGGLRRFKHMLAHMQAGEWAGAARELLDSDYARQVGDRAVRLARQVETDTWQ